MELEESAARRIALRKRRVLLNEIDISVAIALGLTVLVVLIIIPYLAGWETFSPLVKKTGASGSLVAGLIAVVIGLLLVVVYVPGFLRTRRYFLALTRRAASFDAKALARALNALDGVSDDAGVEAPHLVVLAHDVPDSIAFEGRDGPIIGMTRGMLESDLTYSELKAVLAHELASVLAGDYLRRPGSPKWEGAAYIALGALAIAGLFSIAIVRLGRGSLFTFTVALVIWGYVLALGLAVRRFRSLREHDSVMMDSLGVSITGDAQAMDSALRRVDDMVNKRRKMPYPESAYGLDFLFAPPHRWTEDARAWLARRSSELDYDLQGKNVDKRVASIQEEMDGLAEKGRAALEERLGSLAELVDDSDAEE